MQNLAFKAFIFGIISAASLPLGAVAARFFKPGQRFIAFMMSFGGGALLAALTIDMVGETLERGDYWPLAFGCIIGGMLFIVLNQMVNNKGGFLRKAATTINHLKRKKIIYYKRLFEKMSQTHLFNQLPPEEIQTLIPHILTKTYKKGQTIIKQGAPGNSLLIVEDGEVDIIDEKNQSRKIATLKEGAILGEISLVTEEPRSCTAVAATDTHIWIIFKEDFNKILKTYPDLAKGIKELVGCRIGELKDKKTIDDEQAEKWFEQAAKNIDSKMVMPNESDIKEAASLHKNAPLAIWLGILLDGIPESLVIGSSILQHSVSISLLAGLFISNFPEAMSSSVEMKKQKYPFGKIFWMWTSLMVITGIGAFIGNIFFVEAPQFLFSIVNGMAAGAMLTMIAETMLPEAYYKGGAITGFSTLLGFLAAIFFKTLE
ncbi:MAG: cyclic nucleotide-binding domain-containing protein [Endomicrobiales bacterium]|nr:cyclic nucleotide-binding domain-containing protein [Endomicrobiales bacterium]